MRKSQRVSLQLSVISYQQPLSERWGPRALTLSKRPPRLKIIGKQTDGVQWKDSREGQRRNPKPNLWELFAGENHNEPITSKGPCG